jgi:outer membrane lipoprotein-sorting protein
MKKLLLSISLVLFLTGCTKNYNSVDEYQAEMEKVKTANKSYTIEAKFSTYEGNGYFRSKFKGDKWKSELSMNDGLRYLETTIFDGKEILKYKLDSKIAVTIPGFNSEDTDFNSLINPTHSLYEWEKDMFGLDLDKSKKVEFLNQKEIKNNFPCRMIKYSYQTGGTKEVCVSDKYGIAVYSKQVFKNPQPGKEDIVSELNAVKISTDELNDTEFQLPEDVKKMNFEQLMNELNSSLGKMNTTLQDLSKTLK